ncbi:hypothetical protein GCM10029992_12720 [Glycomyces albus]
MLTSAHYRTPDPRRTAGLERTEDGRGKLTGGQPATARAPARPHGYIRCRVRTAAAEPQSRAPFHARLGAGRRVRRRRHRRDRPLRAHHRVPHGTFDVATLVANVVGGFLIGVLMVLITEIYPGSRLIRPFLGVGVLGGFTTFSAYIVDIGRAANAGQTFIAVAFAFTTLATALLAAAAGMYTTRRLHGRRGETE